jgi:homoserine/homoserine lactone efflux protein
MELSTWLTFFVAAWAISLSPGAGAVAAMSAGLNYGFKKGYFVTLGLVLGIWMQIVVVGLGLGALIATSNVAFALVKWLGVAYLIWLGFKQWRAPAVPMISDSSGNTEHSATSKTTLVLRGWMINAVNPKGTVFLLAVVPQFLDLGRALGPQYLVIAATVGFTDLIVMAGYTVLAAKLLRLLKSPIHIRWMNRSFGSLFVAAGVWLATFNRS